MRFLLPCLCAVYLLSSCVPNRKFTYLQHNDVNKSELPNDTVLRTYSLDVHTYKVQSQDILSVHFESLTPKEYDFFTRSAGQQNMNVTGGNALIMGELVDEKGEIPLPVVGKVKVAGLTVFEIQEQLQALANQYIESPIVKVRLLNFRITVLGEVIHEGSITLSNNRVNMMEAVGLAGGLTDIADKKNVKLIRQKNGTAEVSYINLLDEKFITSPYFYVHQNDILVVPPLKQRPYRKYFGQNIGLVISSLSLILLIYNITN